MIVQKLAQDAQVHMILSTLAATGFEVFLLKVRKLSELFLFRRDDLLVSDGDFLPVAPPKSQPVFLDVSARSLRADHARFAGHGETRQRQLVRPVENIAPLEFTIDVMAIDPISRAGLRGFRSFLLGGRWFRFVVRGEILLDPVHDQTHVQLTARLRFDKLVQIFAQTAMIAAGQL